MTMLMLNLTYEDLLSKNVANENIGNGKGSINEDHVENPSRTIPILQEHREEIVSC